MSQTSVQPRRAVSTGLITFAAVAMIMIGVFQAVRGLVALFNDDFYVVGQKWIFEFDLTMWGWIHLIIGIGIAVAGIFGAQRRRVRPRRAGHLGARCPWPGLRPLTHS